MRKIKKLLLFILTLIFCSTCFACSKSGSAVDFYAFDTVIHVETHDSTLSKHTQTELNQLFVSLSQEFACNYQTSTIYKLNGATEQSEIQISERVMQVFNLSKSFYYFTDKKFNPAVYPLVKLWQFDDYDYSLQNFTPPNHQDVLALLGETVNFDNILLNQQALTVSKTNPQTKIDFGGILKGYAVDKAFEILSNAGHKSGYISIGGSSLYLLSVNSLSIRHPRATTETPTIISVNGKYLNSVAVSTSGDYEKYHENNGIKYNHIISPLTGYPTDTGIISATIVGANGSFGDAVTTAMCLMEHSLGSKNSELTCFINKILLEYPDCIVFAVYNKDGAKEVVTNKNQGEYFTLLDNSYSINQI